MLTMLNMLGVEQIEIYLIYLLTNIENDKKYVGQTKDIKARWSHHKSDARCRPEWPISFAIAKYSSDKFTLDIIDFAVGAWQAGCMEDNYMTIHNSLTTGWGYNVVRGGMPSPMTGRKHSKESKDKISSAHKGKPKLNKRKLNDVGEEKIVDLYQSGLPANKLGKQFGVNSTTIYRVLRKHDIQRRSVSEATKGRLAKNKLNFGNVIETQICDFYKSGMAGPDIGKRFNISNDVIYRILYENNIKIRSTSEIWKGKPQPNKHKFNNVIEEQIVILYQSGLSGPDIGKKFNTSAENILDILKRHNIKIRSISEANKGKPKIKSRKFSEDIEKQIIICYQSGLSAINVGKKFGASRGTVFNILQRNNVEKRYKPGNYKK